MRPKYVKDLCSFVPKMRQKCSKFAKMRQNFFNFLKMRQKLPLYFGNVRKSAKF